MRWRGNGSLDWSSRSGYQAIKTLIAAGTHFTALFCANDQMAIGALQALSELPWRHAGHTRERLELLAQQLVADNVAAAPALDAAT